MLLVDVIRCSAHSAHVTRDECLGVSRLRLAAPLQSPAVRSATGVRGESPLGAVLIVLVYPRVHKCVERKCKACAPRVGADDIAVRGDGVLNASV